MTDKRSLVSSGSYLEPIIGFSRAVRVGNHIAIGGTAPIRAEGGTAGIGDVYAQTRRCLEIIEKALNDAGGTLDHVTRTRIILTDIALWKDAARAHAEAFGTIRPVTTLMQVTALSIPTGWWNSKPTPSSQSRCAVKRLGPPKPQ